MWLTMIRLAVALTVGLRLTREIAARINLVRWILRSAF